MSTSSFNLSHKSFSTVLLLTLFVIFFFIFTSKLQACSGTVDCCTSIFTSCEPAGCNPADPKVPCNCSPKCSAHRIADCNCDFGSCGIYALSGCYMTTGGCSGSCTPSTPLPTTAPPSGGCTEGDCFPVASDCGAYGRDPGSGSCSGGMCCKPRGIIVAACIDATWRQTGQICWDPRGAAPPRPGPCDNTYFPPNCCSGLFCAQWESYTKYEPTERCTVWNWRCAASCGAIIVTNSSNTPVNTINVTQGETNTFSTYRTGTGTTTRVLFTIQPNGSPVTINPGIDNTSPFQTNIRGNAIGSYTLNITYNTNPETTASCSRNITINVTAPPTPPPSQLTGTVYFDPDRIAHLSGNTCIHSGSLSPFTPSGANTSSVTYGTVAPTITSSVRSDGTYGPINISPNSIRNAILSIEDPYVLACTNDGTYAIPRGDTLPPGSTLVRNYYVSLVKDSWFQTVGGDIHGTSGIRNRVPSCTGSCLPFTSLLDNLPTAKSTGLATYSDPLSPTFGGNSFDEEDRELVARINPNPDNYFAGFRQIKRIFEVDPLNLPEDFPIFHYNASKPTTSKPYFYTRESLTISTPWSVSDTESITIFIEGDLTVSAPISVAPGGFLAFVVQGNITFPASLGTTPDSTTPIVEGIYIADGTLTVESTSPETKFVGAGTFVGHSGINLNRDYQNLDNNIYPAELFIFRPDLVLNTPIEFKRFSLFWKQLPP